MRVADFVIEFWKKGISTVFTVSGGGPLFYVMLYIKQKIKIYSLSP